MYCSKCGIELPEDANYCYRCGTPLHEHAGETKKTFWEYCQIELEVRKKRFGAYLPYGFFASAVGPNGSYPAGRSPEFKIKNQIRGPTRKEGGTAHDQFVKHLLEDGWEPVAERGEDWWQLRFRRRVDR
jgi:hypothetical protein